MHGWQTGFLVVRPSANRLRSLLSRVGTGDYSLFTRTEQDVIDAEFDPAAHCGAVADNRTSSTPSTNAEGMPARRLAASTFSHERAFEAPGCVGHAYLGLPLLRSVVHHHKIHAGIAEPRAGPKDRWWRDQVLWNLTSSLCGVDAVRPVNSGDKVVMGPVASRRVLLAATAIKSLWRSH